MHSMAIERLERLRAAAWDVTAGSLRIALALVRLPLLALLMVLEPLVCGALWLCATLGVLTCLFYRFLIHSPGFPFWGGLALSIGAALLAAAYHGLIRVVGGSED